MMGYFGRCSTGTCPLTANPYRGAFIGALIGGVLAFSAAGPRANPEGNKEGYSAVYIENADDFNRLVLQADKPVLVDFYLSTCGPCRQLAPTIEVLAEEYEGRAVVCKVNAAKVPQVSQRYDIQGVPAVLFFSEGGEVERLVGLRPKEAYIKTLDKLIG